MIQPRSLSVALNQFRKRRILWNGIVFFQVVCTAAGEQRRYHPSRMAVGWAVVSRLCVRQRSAGTVANGPLANSSPCQRRSNHQNIIGVSEERPKQRALSSIRESLSRVNAISLRCGSIPNSSSPHLSVSLALVQLHMSPNMLANSAH